MAKFADVQSMQVGDFKVTFFLDGGGLIAPTAIYPAADPKGWEVYHDYIWISKGAL